MSVPAPRKNVYKTPWPEIRFLLMLAGVFTCQIGQSAFRYFGMVGWDIAANGLSLVFLGVMIVGYFKKWWVSK